MTLSRYVEKLSASENDTSAFSHGETGGSGITYRQTLRIHPMLRATAIILNAPRLYIARMWNVQVTSGSLVACGRSHKPNRLQLGRQL